MTSGLRKVQPGDPPSSLRDYGGQVRWSSRPRRSTRLPGEAYGGAGFVDTAQDFLRRQRDIGRTPVADRPPFETVLLKNASGADRSRFDLLGIDAPVFAPADSLETFTNGIALAGVTPADGAIMPPVPKSLEWNRPRRLRCARATLRGHRNRLEASG